MTSANPALSVLAAFSTSGLIMSRVVCGTTPSTLWSTDSTAFSPSPTSPRIDTSASSAGADASTA
ncbi:Uncharacterised protein [Mycobacteroides abscessus]|nr:Uncharacterised protein [Mycobacteroides abscessus]